MRTNKLPLLLAALVAGTALLALAPTAEAQNQGSVTVQLNAPSESVKPLQGPITFTGTVTLTGDGSAMTGVVGVPVQYTVTKQPAWANVLVSPASDVFPVPQPPTGANFQATKTITITVTASDQAPAFQADTIEITAQTTGASAGGSSFSGKGSTPITANYFSIIDVQLAEAIKVERPQTAVAFPLKITNFGNANTKVIFEIIDKTESLKTPIPNPVILQSKQAGGNQISADIPLTIQTPYKNGYLNEVGVVNYKLASSYALDPKIKGDESSVSLLVTTRGFYVPGPSPIVFLALLGVVVLAVRRFR